MIADVMTKDLSMISNLNNVATLAAFLATMMMIAAAMGYTLLLSFNTITVVAGVLLGRATFGLAGLDFSTGAPFTAMAMLGIAIHHRLYGRMEFFRALRNIIFGLIVVFGSLFLLDHANLLSPLFDGSIRKAGVRMICIYLMQSLAIHLLDKPSSIPAVMRIPAIVMLCEILEGVIFYPCIQLGEKSPTWIIDYTISSISVRLMTTLLAVPFLAVLLILERKGGLAKCTNRA